MDIDGSNRKKIADYAREPFWSPDGKVIGYLDQEYPKFNVIDYYTKGMNFYDLATGTITPHPNYTNLHHLYNPNFCANGKWIVSTVHAGMGYDHTILLIEAHGNKIINLKIPGCRPAFSPDGQHIAWGASDNEIAAAPIDTDSDEPKVGEWRVRIKDAKNKIYHARWSPDGRFLSFSRGPDGEGRFEQAGDVPGGVRDHGRLCDRLEYRGGVRPSTRGPMISNRDRCRFRHADNQWFEQQGVRLVPAAWGVTGVRVIRSLSSNRPAGGVESAVFLRQVRLGGPKPGQPASRAGACFASHCRPRPWRSSPNPAWKWFIFPAANS